MAELKGNPQKSFLVLKDMRILINHIMHGTVAFFNVCWEIVIPYLVICPTVVILLLEIFPDLINSVSCSIVKILLLGQ